MDEFEAQFKDFGNGGDNGSIEPIPLKAPGRPEEKPKGHEPHPTAHLVGKVATEDVIYELEERWRLGQELNLAELGLLALAGEDLRSDFYR